jgi:hypothetical protein
VIYVHEQSSLWKILILFYFFSLLFVSRGTFFLFLYFVHVTSLVHERQDTVQVLHL